LLQGTPAAGLYLLSLHDALPIWCRGRRRWRPRLSGGSGGTAVACAPDVGAPYWGYTNSPSAAASRGARSRAWRPGSREDSNHRRSEEHTSELQSREKLVCRLLLE